MNKPEKPNIIIPESFAENGVKTDFDSNKILNGFDRIQPDVLAGDNLNKFIDDTYKGLNYGIKSVDYLEERWKSQITNCLLEIPQRIKHTLENGTLTIKAGSVVIVPYGTEDLTSQYSVGATFLNDNFKVYDTQFADGMFFVWAEIQNNLSITYEGSTTSANGMFFIDIVNGIIYIEAIRNIGSGTGSTTVPSYYNTTTNKLTHNQTGTISLPALECTFGTSITNSFAINNVFNGMGYIGSTIWIDKGVKGLLPNGRNEDGSLKNVEWTNDKIRTSSGLATGAFDLVYKLNTDVFEMNKLANWSFNEDKNIYVYRDGTEYTLITLGRISLNTGTIIAFNPKQPFRAVDNQDIDGNWTYSINNLIETVSFAASEAKVYDLSDYLPNDGNVYEVLVSTYMTIGSSNGNRGRLLVGDATTGVSLNVCTAITRTNSSMITSGSIILPMISRQLYVTNSGDNGAVTISLNLCGYRKVR